MNEIAMPATSMQDKPHCRKRTVQAAELKGGGKKKDTYLKRQGVIGCVNFVRTGLSKLFRSNVQNAPLVEIRSTDDAAAIVQRENGGVFFFQ
jgi:hypothetical protein